MDVELLIEQVKKFPVLYDQTSEKYRNSEYKQKIWKHIATKLRAKGGIDECKKKWTSLRDQLRRTIQKRKSASGQGVAFNRKYKYEDILDFLIPHLWERDTSSNVSVSQECQQEDDEIESIISNTQEEQTWQLLNTNSIKEEPEIEDQKFLPAYVDDNSLSAFSSCSSVEKEQFSKPVHKRKKSRVANSSDNSANQLMTYILAKNENDCRIIRPIVQEPEKHPVDAFLCGLSPTLKSLNPILLNQAKGRIFAVVQEFEMKQLMSNQYDVSGNPKPSSSNSVSFSPQPTSQSVTTNSPPPALHIQTANISDTKYNFGNQTQTLGSGTSDFPDQP